MANSFGYFTTRPQTALDPSLSSRHGIAQVGDALLHAMRMCGRVTEISCREDVFRLRGDGGLAAVIPSPMPERLPHFKKSILDSQRLAFLRIPNAAIFVHDLFSARALHPAAPVARDLREYPLILTPSLYTAAMVCDRTGVPREKVRVTPLDCDRTEFRLLSLPRRVLRAQLGLPVNRPVVLHVSYGYPRKNVSGILRAFRRVLAEIPEALLVKVGRNSHDDKLLSQATDLSDDMIVLERMSRSRLAMLYNAADCFVFPSLMEGFGLPVLEAQACGCPVVTSNTTALAEIAGPLCRTVNPFDVEAIGAAIVATLEDHGHRSHTAAANADWLTRFSWNPLRTAVREWLS